MIARQPLLPGAKRALKRSVAATAGRFFARGSETRVVVLCYHSIHPTLPFASASPDRFRSHLEWLGETCDVVPLADVPRLAREGKKGRPVVALTFDDGYRDNATYALPLLQEAGLTATFFLTVGLIEGNPDVVGRFARLRGASSEDVAGITWSEAAELLAAGHDVGSHTLGHRVLGRLGRDDAREELARSREALEERLGLPVTLLAYPFGKPGAHFTAATQELARGAGYTLATAAVSRGVRASDSPFAVPRFFASGDGVDAIAAKVRGSWDWLGLWQEHAPGWLVRRLSPEDYRDPDELEG